MNGYYVSQKVRHDDGSFTYHLSFAKADGGIIANAGTVTEHARGLGVEVRDANREAVTLGSRTATAMCAAVVSWLRA